MSSLHARVSRRATPALAAVIGAGLVAAGVTVPAFAEDPAIPNVSGVVTNAAGAGLVGMTVVAYKPDPDTGKYTDNFADVQTGAGGAFLFEDLPVGNYKFRAVGGGSFGGANYPYDGFPTGATPYNSIPYIGEWGGDAESEYFATVVPVTTNITGLNFALTQYGHVTGTNYANGAPLYESDADAYSATASFSGYSPTSQIDPNTGECSPQPCVPKGGQAFHMFVEPGTYRISLGGYNYTPEVIGPPYVPEKYFYFTEIFYGGTYSAHDAKRVTVASGQTITVGGTLSANLANLVKARIEGQPAPGKTLRANPGHWSGLPSFKFTWTVNGLPAGTGPTYVVKAADLKKKVVLTVQAHADGDAQDLLGVAQLTTKVGLPNKLKAKAKKLGDGKLRFELKLKGKKKLAGKYKGKAEVWMLPLGGNDQFAYEELGAKAATPKRVGKAKVGADGTATITTKKLPTGKALFMVTYSGSKKAAANQTPWRTIAVK